MGIKIKKEKKNNTNKNLQMLATKHNSQNSQFPLLPTIPPKLQSTFPCFHVLLSKKKNKNVEFRGRVCTYFQYIRGRWSL